MIMQDRKPYQRNLLMCLTEIIVSLSLIICQITNHCSLLILCLSSYILQYHYYYNIALDAHMHILMQSLVRSCFVIIYYYAFIIIEVLLLFQHKPCILHVLLSPQDSIRSLSCGLLNKKQHPSHNLVTTIAFYISSRRTQGNLIACSNAIKCIKV